MSTYRHRGVQRLLAILPLAAFLLTGCLQRGPKIFDPRQVAFQAEYNPLFDGQLYPALILGLNHSNLNSQFPIFSIELTAPADNAVLRVVIDSSALNYVTIIQEILPRRGETYRFQPSVKWKYDYLRALRQPGAVDLTFTCYINDEEVDIKNLHLNYRTVNECPLSLVSDGQASDFRWLFAAYVNEDHPQIEQILTDIMEQGTVSRLAGYQTGGAKAVRDQVFAVWYYALNRGITYSSITCTSNPSPRANVQHIRFFDEVLTTRQANCVDACVFFASILRKIGLKPVIFVEPCHAYLGYYTDRNRKQTALLETTITSWVNFPDMERSLDADGRLPDAKWQKIKKYLSDKEVAQYEEGRMSFEQLKMAVARSLFDKAAEYDRETYDANREHFADSTSITYQQLDIELLRKQVQPIN
ncbi:MAG: transglutaminase domain-containing protein [Bacteroidales bacterium]|nr:transglutaminase domain-containing protein [Bacteroidales bacterium]